MKKIASPKELTQEIRSIIAYSESPSPSREKLSSDLQTLANRVGAEVKAKLDFDQRVGLNELKKHLTSALDSAKQAAPLVKELAKAAEGNKSMERQFDRYRGDVSTAVINLAAMLSGVERWLEDQDL